MDLKQLEYFVRVAELGSFTRASQVLDVAQPALSRQVRSLEVELRQNLLVRNGRGVTLTDAGNLLLEHGRGILHQLARAKEELAVERGGLAGRVALGLPPSVARAYAVPLMRTFRQRLPQAQLSITEALSIAMQESLASGRLDIAVIYNAQPTAGLDLRPLMEEELVLVQQRPLGLAEDPPLPVFLTQLADLPLVIPSRPNAIRMQVESELATIGRLPRVALEIDGVPAILELVAEGLGSAVLTRHAVASSVRPSAYAVRSIGDPPLRVRSWLATSANRPVTRTQQAVIELLKELVSAG
ncbi:LysR family transcriptional regulator, nitrogen assimilation regulatory protein [Variovorax sp. HW608]|uniref:LysR substrate-binding domain-containing protein n=1 Tax=Variovorax sp. HW608 TaxID=1034889 RepID=UPI00081F78D5|nr:LysR substrate-binding domain-containing protein [Variovorax sp. HW608]SCK15813.1 LysR family transcriptional regulator, nitrogen assimilation regulatory protein [Variovorax sp. HW608]